MESIERRQERRVTWQGEVRLVISSSHSLEATITDISEFGCGLQISRPVETGLTVGIDGTGFEGSGVVRYCYPLAGGFRVGIQLLPPHFDTPGDAILDVTPP